ncbi:hypothetical protein [Qipengyuania flava]|uniref:hypothetical protein n=1 Tax=Qipengyuania flava TaxID=192812 RepID=UPI001C633DD3|nr:hypothetical protein [Qipengyuania flava]QYJ06122.1 hypothetical protein KUV82_08460 [Qipengyuania flava]
MHGGIGKGLVALVASASLVIGCNGRGGDGGNDSGDSGGDSGGPSIGPINLPEELATTLPENCASQPGFAVNSITINDDGPIILNDGETHTLDVSMDITPPDDGFQTACLLIRDAGLIPNPIGVGVALVADNGAEATSDLRITCEDGEVKGAGQGILGGELNRSSGERRTRIYVQHARDERQVGNATVGIQGVKSNRIRIRCRR